MIFFIISEKGVDTTPLTAPDLATAADIVRKQVGNGKDNDGVTPVQVALLIPDAVATVTPNADPTLATIDATFTASAANRATLVSRANAALTANATFLGLASPTNAQVLAQVQLLTKECNALIRLAIGALDTTTGT